MAIIVTEEKNRAGLIRILGWVGILAALGAAVYYIFFAAPELVIIEPTGSLSAIAPIAQLSIHPQDITGSPAFQSLQYALPEPTPNGPVTLGRTNPFISP